MTKVRQGTTRGIRRWWRRITANRNIKDVLFRYIFKDRKALLLLYNALNQSNYDNPELLEIVTLENAIYMGIKDDLAFIIENVMSLYEHQSTINYNMPIRGLLYFASQYEVLIEKMGGNIYGKKMIELPTPQFVVFYNGNEDAPERQELRLSNSYAKKVDNPAVEVIATMININYNHNMELLNACRPLRDYSYFISKIKEYQGQRYSFNDAVDLAVDYCIAHDILREILELHKGEVKKMLLTEYNPKKYMKMAREEAREEGHAEGKAEGKAEGHAEGHAEGKAEGHAEGKAEGKAEQGALDVILLLSLQGELPKKLIDRIKAERNEETLKSWLLLAAKAGSIEQFREESGLME